MVDPTFVANIGGQQGILARTMYGEDRGDGAPGMDAVGCVIRNRVRIAAAFIKAHGRPHPLYGDGSYASACLVPWQFSSWNAGDPNRAKIIAVTAETDPIFAEALDLAAEIIAGQIADPTNGATSYKESSLPWPASWGTEVPARAVIGHQSYYCLI